MHLSGPISVTGIVNAARSRRKKPDIEWQNEPKPRKYLTHGNKVTPFFDGKEMFSAARTMVESAQSLIQVEMYQFTDKEMASLLVREAEKGVKVQVILDPNQTQYDPDAQEIVESLKDGGVEVCFYPVNRSRGLIDHMKLLIVDGKQVLIGGTNWGERSHGNHDANLKVEGPLANYCEKVFQNGWRVSGGEEFDSPRKATMQPDGTAAIRAGMTELFRIKQIKDLALEAIAEARKSIYLEMFCLSDKKVIQALIEAHNRGVDVRVLLAPNGVQKEEGRTSWNPNGQTFETLREAGVPVKWYDVDRTTDQKLHAKWGVFDGDKVILGSANWTFKGFYINRETSVDVRDEKTGSLFQSHFEECWRNHSLDKLPEAPLPSGEESGGAPPPERTPLFISQDLEPVKSLQELSASEKQP
ncbi:MAG: phosphatidylserine/phosphatidylglycerophosphate/cardiolipin synthase family protein [Armatimonadetes bacterium]|nr:phosphatidylserine/phosphatidylglycerophosphate/cardiolipin synthase family protein [Armatimonadota bacterium]